MVKGREPTSTKAPAERVVLFRLILPGETPEQVEEDLKELTLLTKTAGGEVVGILTQRRPHPDPAYFIGRGKVEELRELVKSLGAHTVICDDDLKPGQVRNISRVLGNDVKILDRSALILDIFALHARTPEAKIQVQLAQLQYLLPRLAGMWRHLERQYGAIGVRGPGEKQIELDRRAIANQIAILRRKLAKIERERQVQRKRRRNLFRVALVGYTNAGKSSLLNALTDAGVYVEDKLFATLDATTRRLTNGEHTILITDTVGFIKKLPHHLVESFKSTLAESREADVLLIVADIAHPAVEEHIQIVHSVLDEIGAVGKRILVLNKIDLLSSDEIAYFRDKFPDAHLISVLQGRGIEYLKNCLLDMAEARQLKGKIN